MPGSKDLNPERVCGRETSKDKAEIRFTIASFFKIRGVILGAKQERLRFTNNIWRYICASAPRPDFTLKLKSLYRCAFNADTTLYHRL